MSKPTDTPVSKRGGRPRTYPDLGAMEGYRVHLPPAFARMAEEIGGSRSEGVREIFEFYIEEKDIDIEEYAET